MGVTVFCPAINLLKNGVAEFGAALRHRITPVPVNTAKSVGVLKNAFRGRIGTQIDIPGPRKSIMTAGIGTMSVQNGLYAFGISIRGCIYTRAICLIDITAGRIVFRAVPEKKDGKNDKKAELKKIAPHK